MAELTMEAVEDVPVQTRTKTRLYFVDHLRAALTILVVLHHVALVYGASAPFYYTEPPFGDGLAYNTLLVFALLNQAWFMGAFFMLAGYFTPGSFERKGAGVFLKDRLIRLGIPLIVFIFVLSPIASLGYYLMPAELTGITTSPSWQAYPHLIGLGPLWFVAMLLIFSLGYVAWRVLRPDSTKRQVPLPGWLLIGGFILALALLSYLLRMVVPLGKDVSFFADFLSFPTLAYLPQYLSFFILGIIAYRGNWFRSLPRSMSIVGLVVAALTAVILLPLALSGRLFTIEISEPAMFVGNGSWQSAVYALWDSIFAVGMMLGLIPLFRRYLNQQSRIGSFLAQQSYAVYIIHIPIVVFLTYALRNVGLANLPRFVLAALIIVPVCFVAAYLLRKLPFASRVI